MQTVQDLIDLLNTIEDKTLPIGTYSDEHRDGPALINPLPSYSIETQKHFNFKKNEYENVTFVSLRYSHP